MSVSHAKHWQIREICEIRVLKIIRVIRVIRVQNDEWFKMMSVQDDEWFICGKWIHVIGVTHDRCDTWF